MDKRFTLNEHEKAKISGRLKGLLFKREEIVFAYLFGSFVTEPFFRDIDIGIYLREESIPRERALDYELSLGVELEGEIHYPLDVKVLNYAPVPLSHSASGGLLLFSRNEELRYEWVERTWDIYLDMEYFLRSNLRDLLISERKNV
ncbi:nucleotidyltransferase domain-containing protein [Desulfofundulus thermobenzoicus]|uniref:Nucleotidyltransferase domain-containing protein n=1 Tax=Desulfofundulus thermobenzoicus TaxID=29376 RepID=A0A6N7IT42_9FIRM|nr:nucleotidyltransferase domain-containing protein [Desulfofundulus thermobenzoicus]HHW42341.1 nucleotidyltransferase domain-containing protein [Desulfotomaculum sp.]